jgi:hypothetical protein
MYHRALVVIFITKSDVAQGFFSRSQVMKEGKPLIKKLYAVSDVW